MRKVVFNTWNGAFFNPGGGEVQLLNSKTALEDKGFNIAPFNLWSPQKDISLLHQFSINFGVEHVVKEYKNHGIKIALSPIYWHRPEKESLFYQHVKSLLDLSDIIFTNSESETNLLSNHFSVSQFKFLKTRNSITDHYLTLGASEQFRRNFNIHNKFILSVANIDSRKNTHLLLEATKDFGIQVILIGHIRDPQYWDSFRQDYKHYKYLGPITDTELLKSAYRACEVFALPSLCETPGIAALEAASQGAKIVITTEGATREYFKDFAFYASPTDVKCINQSIDLALNSKSNDNQIKYIRDNFTWEKTAIDIIEGYNRLLKDQS